MTCLSSLAFTYFRPTPSAAPTHGRAVPAQPLNPGPGMPACRSQSSSPVIPTPPSAGILAMNVCSMPPLLSSAAWLCASEMSRNRCADVSQLCPRKKETRPITLTYPVHVLCVHPRRVQVHAACHARHADAEAGEISGGGHGHGLSGLREQHIVGERGRVWEFD
jgi:hypothetical protein